MATPIPSGTLLAAILAVTSTVVGAACTPGSNCDPPACRCWNDPSPPAGLDPIDMPQMVLISFAYTLNTANSDLYSNLFESLNNPNGCPARGTFFVQKTGTDLGEVNRLRDLGHEIGLTSSDGTVPNGTEQWKDSVAEAKNFLVNGGIPEQEIKGFRAPQLLVDGDAQFQALKEAGLLYDSSCVSLQYRKRESLLWPYTYDYADETPACTAGNLPSQAYDGFWQFLIADLEYQGQVCATPSSCSDLLNDAQEVFNFLYDSFLQHYDERRTPFILYIDPLWLTVDYQLEGTRQFLQLVQSAFDDTWLITNRQALEWIQDPLPSVNISNFTPWQCT